MMMMLLSRSWLRTVLLLTPLLLTGSASGWVPGSYPVGSNGFTVDAQDRNDVVSFWHAVYQASEGYWDRHGWTGNYTAAAPYDSGVGTTAAAFVKDTERRINFHRALCGVPANVRLNTGSTVQIDPSDPYKPPSNTTKEAAVRRSAYMVVRTCGPFLGKYYPPLGDEWAAVGHNPDPTKCVAWTAAAWNANHCGAVDLGSYGPGAVDAYIAEELGTGGTDPAENAIAGHRRWLLHPGSTDMATGDTPGAYDSATNWIWQPTNVIYVVPKITETVTVPPRFTSFPPAGYFPASLNGRFWSLAYPGANFATATVTMTTANGTPVIATVVARNGDFGTHPALVWQVGAEAMVKSVTADRTFHVAVSGITGNGVPASRNYSVTLINPNQITSDQTLFGPTAPSASLDSGYQLTPPDHAEAIQVNSYQAVSTAWTEGAEDSPTPQVTANTTGTYAFRSTCVFSSYPAPYFVPISNAKSFRLTFPYWYDPRLKGVPEQSFELDRVIIPSGSGQLSFKYRRGMMSTATSLIVESSSDEGISWRALGDPILGAGKDKIDSTSTSATRALTAGSGPLRIRFRLSYTQSPEGYLADQFLSGVDWRTYPTGIFLDDISTTNCQWLELKKTNELAPSATWFTLNSTTAGLALGNDLALQLRMRTKLGNRWMPSGPMKTVAFVAAGARAPTPEISPTAGTHAAGQTITISSESEATIHYRINGGAVRSAPSPFTGLTVPAYPDKLSISAYASKSGKWDSDFANACYSGTLFSSWAAAYFPGVTDPLVIGAAADPDRDGEPNILEFALGGDPNGPDKAVIKPRTNDGTPTSKLLVTIAVRAGTPAFTGSPCPSATHDGVTYTLLGGFTPSQTDAPISVVAPQAGDLPAAPTGYEYRTFKLNCSEGLPSKGFMRVKIEESL